MSRSVCNLRLQRHRVPFSIHAAKDRTNSWEATVVLSGGCRGRYCNGLIVVGKGVVDVVDVTAVADAVDRGSGMGCESVEVHCFVVIKATEAYYARRPVLYSAFGRRTAVRSVRNAVGRCTTVDAVCIATV